MFLLHIDNEDILRHLSPKKKKGLKRYQQFKWIRAIGMFMYIGLGFFERPYWCYDPKYTVILLN